MDTNLEMVELLRQINDSTRKQQRYLKFQCILALITVVCFAAAVVMVGRFMPQLQSSTAQLQTILGNMETVSEELASLDLQGMVTGVETLVQTGQDSLEQTMGKLDTIDFDSLNKAIDDLSAVVEPMANFVNKFNFR